MQNNTTRVRNRRQHDEDRFGRRQPRPAPRRQRTRSAVVLAALAEEV